MHKFIAAVCCFLGGIAGLNQAGEPKPRPHRIRVPFGADRPGEAHERAVLARLNDEEDTPGFEHAFDLAKHCAVVAGVVEDV